MTELDQLICPAPAADVPAAAKPTILGLLKATPGLFYREWGRVEVTQLAAQVAYSLLFAIPALALLTMSIAAFIEANYDVAVASTMQEWIDDYAPPEIEELLTYIVDQAISQVASRQVSVQLVLAILLGLWSASNGAGALINATNRAYGVIDTRAYHRKRGRAVVLAGIGTALVIFALVLFIVGQSYGSQFADQLDLSATYNWIWSHFRWPATVGALIFALIGLYQFGPLERPPLRWTIPGALIATGLWVAALFGFQFYLTFTNPGSPYGVTGSVIILMVFLYYTGVVFILGALINGILWRWFRPDETQPPVP